MKIELHNITIKDLFKGYVNNDENGVYAYDGKLNIRPPFQREFIYSDDQQKKVIDTVIKKFPLNSMYWIKGEDGNYELMDGQQRTMSICQYLNGDFTVNVDGFPKGFLNLTTKEREEIQKYTLTVYICEGTEKEKTEWFETVNIAGETLTNQELNNAIYRGTWVTDAKRYFSKTSGPCDGKYSKYLKGSVKRQDYLETVLKWISDAENKSIREYMSEHQNDANASELWQYMQSVMNWVEMLFPKYDKSMKGLDWGFFYNKYKNNKYNAADLQAQIDILEDDDDVTKRSGIYGFLITGDESYLQLRQFDDKLKRKVYKKQKGICKICKKHFELSEMEADHITPWSQGGHTTEENCQMLCRKCNRHKSDK